MTISLNNANRVHVNYYFVIGPQFNFEYQDTEPCDAQLSSSVIKGLVTGVPKLGSGMYMAFVNEEVDARWFGAVDAPTDWGDMGGGGFTHTYTDVGLYYVQVAGGSGALAVRPCRVIYRTKPETYNWQDISYPIDIDGDSTASISEGSFGIKCRVQMGTRERPISDFGVLLDRQQIAIFAQEYRAGTTYGNLQFVIGGFIAEGSLEVQKVPASGDEVALIQFIAYGLSYWLLGCDMREQQYVDPGIIGSQMFSGLWQDINNSITYTQNLLGTGYNPQHWVNCLPTTVALHVLQHVHTYTSLTNTPATPGNPTMEAAQSTNYYGNIGQFFDVNADSDVDESSIVPSGGFHSFTVSDGKVLSNIRGLLENEGFRFYELPNLTINFERKPYYRSVQPAATLNIDGIDNAVKDLFDGFEVSRAVLHPIRQVIVEKAALATLSDVADDGTGDVNQRDPVGFIHDALYTPSGPFNASTRWDQNMASSNFGGNNAVFDPLTQSIDPTQFEARYPDPANAYGETIKLKEVFTKDPLAFAQGVYNERRVRWQVTLPVGQVLNLRLGQIVTLTHSNSVWGYNWTAKKFEVTSMHMTTFKNHKFFLVAVCVEVDPDES